MVGLASSADSFCARHTIIALVCSQPPEGRTRRPVELPAEEAVERKFVARGGRETLRLVSQSPEIKPKRGRNSGGIPGARTIHFGMEQLDAPTRVTFVQP